MGKRRPVPTPAGHQQCHQCLVTKPHADFEPCDYRPAGIKATCRPCLVADREVAAGLRQWHDDISERQYAPTVVLDYEAPTKPVPEPERKSEEHFRRIDAHIRRMRLRRRK